MKNTLIVSFLPLLAWGSLALRVSSAEFNTMPSPPAEVPRFRDPTAPLEQRINDLLNRLTLQEKASQLVHKAVPIPRLELRGYNWWRECLHGVQTEDGRSTTAFPQAIGLAASWNPRLMWQIADAISTEARALFHYTPADSQDLPSGLTMFSPNINIFRDPRWGRGQETYGEDPYLTARLGVAYIQGLQGDDPKYLKIAATPKHYAVHSGPEDVRHQFNARPSARDLHETYLPAFEASIRGAKAASIMCAYNSVDDRPCCANPYLLSDILRDQWNFDGYVVTDCGAIRDLYRSHNVANDAAAAFAQAIQAGCDLNCCYPLDLCDSHTDAICQAVERGLLTEKDLDQALGRLLAVQIRLGMFDPPESNPYAKIPVEVINSPTHQKLTLQAARQSMVLLKNADGILPLAPTLKSIAVIGPHAKSTNLMLGNYASRPPHVVTILDGIRGQVSPDTKVLYSDGCDLLDPPEGDSIDTMSFADALAAAQRSDVVVAAVGLAARLIEDEQKDREDIALPAIQQRLLRALAETGKPLVVVLVNGGPVAVPWLADHAAAIIEAWYPGQEGGAAVAELLFGVYSPAGRLPVTIYESVDQLPDFTNYDMTDRTYRFMTSEPLYPFGFGLSYTQFSHSDLRLEPSVIAPGQTVQATVTVSNIGDRPGEEVVQLYLSHAPPTAWPRRWQLRGFERFELAPGQSRDICFNLTAQDYKIITDEGRPLVKPGVVHVVAGARAPVPCHRIGDQPSIEGNFRITHVCQLQNDH